MNLLTERDMAGMPWSARSRRVRLWHRLVDEYARLHHDRYHVTPRTRRPSCGCPWGVR